MTASAVGVAAGARGVRLGRGAVLVAVAALLGLFAAGLVVWGRHAADLPGGWTGPDGSTAAGVRATLADWGVPVGWWVGYFMALEVFLVAVSVVAAYAVLRGPLSWFRLYLALVLVLFATAGGGVPLVVAGVYPAFAGPASLLQGLAWIALFPLAYVFPDGRFVPRWTRWFALGWVAFLPGSAVLPESAAFLEPVILLPLFGSCAVALVHRYVRVSDRLEREQIKWVVLAIAMRFAYNVVLWTPLGALRGEQSPRGLLAYAALMLLSYLIAAALPAAIAIAIVRHRLFDVDVVISRTLVYAVLTALVVGVYAATLAVVGTLAPLVAAVVVAVGFNPVRVRVQRRVNRLVYGERDDPYGVLSRLGRQLAGLAEPDRVAPTIVESVARALRAPYVAITLDDRIVASAGRAGSDVEDLPIAHRGLAFGRLSVGVRSPRERLTDADRRLLAGLADHSGAALYAARESAETRRLAADLQQTREQLVTAREEERRRIRRDLHDSLGPALGSQALTIDTARTLVGSDPAAAERLLRDAKAHSQELLDDVRRLARRLRPPALDELGLEGALRQAADEQRAAGLEVVVSVGALPALPAAVEVAAYRIAREALTNVVRHAAARTCTLSVVVDGGALDVVVDDDGRGLAPGAPAGVGTASMRERAEELGGTLDVRAATGGGTRVAARIPLREPE
jgi:signal transduction histidine kinase